MYIKLSTFIFTGLLLTWSLFTSSLTFAEEGIEYQFVLAWGSEGSDNGQFRLPKAIAIAPDGSVYIVDSTNNRIQQFSAQGKFIRSWGNLGSNDGQFNNPVGIAIAPDGNIYITDSGNDRVQQFNTQGDFIRSWGENGTGNGQFNIPEGIAIAPDGSVYVSNVFIPRIQQFSAQGDFIQTWGSHGSDDGQFNFPAGIAIASDGSVYVTDKTDHRIQKFNAQGEFLRTFKAQISDNDPSIPPVGIAIASDGSIYVANSSTSAETDVIQQFNDQGDFIRSWGKEGTGEGQLVNVGGIAIASDGSFYVADTGNNRIQKFEPKNKVNNISSSLGSFAEPSDIPEQAIPILVNDAPQYHLLDDEGDQDWFEFYAELGTRYTILLPQASLGSAIDPVITLFDEAGNELESVNNSPLGQEEQLDWTATDTALFRIRVTNEAVIKTKAKPSSLEDAYTINVFLSDAPQQGIIKGSVLDSCQELGLEKVVITAALGGQLTESTFTHKTGEYSIPINPGDYDLNTQIENYQNSQKNVSVAQVTASQVQFSLDPVTDCSQTPIRVADPTTMLQQAVANYNDQTGVLIIKDVLADGRTYYAELQDQGGYNFSLTDAMELPGPNHSGPADYSFETLLVNIPAVFAFNTLYKVQMKNGGDFFFSLVDASTP